MGLQYFKHYAKHRIKLMEAIPVKIKCIVPEALAVGIPTGRIVMQDLEKSSHINGFRAASKSFFAKKR